MTQGVVLVSMPWGPVHEPSLGLAVLKACLQRHDIACTVIHAAPQLLRWVTVETYQFLSECWGLNEYLFTGVLDDGPLAGPQAEALSERLQLAAATQRHPHYRDAKHLREIVQTLRQEIVPAFVQTLAEQVLDADPVYVGFTCMFDQTMASLAVAKRIKALQPRLPVVLGGYALQGPVAGNVLRAFPFVDAIVLGDGEQEVLRLYERFAQSPPDGSPAQPFVVHAAKVDMANSPTPDFSDWYAGLGTLERQHQLQLHTRVLPVEASRGCWWGQLSHCTFCGIDDDAMQYRYKSADTVLQMLHTLRQRHGDVLFRFSDYIMPKAYYTELLPRLAQEPRRFRLQSEIKANHPPERVALLAAAGYQELQPGIESFSTPVLKAMRKGVRAIDNVSLLKAAYLHNITIDYNILYGLPSDTLDDYDQMLAQMPMLYHLMPPISRNGTMVTRFAPLQTQPERFGLSPEQVHHRCYKVLFSADFLAASGFELDDYAYYFERGFDYPEPLHEKYRQVTLQVEHWKAQLRERFVELSITLQAGVAQVCDSRFSQVGETYTLDADETRVYQAFDAAPHNIDRSRAELTKQGVYSGTAFDDIFCGLLERRLLWQEDALALGLAIPKPQVEAMQGSGIAKRWMSLYT